MKHFLRRVYRAWEIWAGNFNGKNRRRIGLRLAWEVAETIVREIDNAD